MKQHQKKKSPRRNTLPGLLAVGFISAAALVAPAQSDAANTAANAPITATASVAYQDNNGHIMAPQAASVTVTIALLKAAPTLTAPATLAASIQPDVKTTTYAFTLATNANGPDTYTLTNPTSVQSAGITGTTINLAPNNDGTGPTFTTITLGASTVAAGTAINPDNATTAEITCVQGVSVGGLNGIPTGASVYIGTHGPYTVTNADTATWKLTVRGSDAYTPLMGDTVRQVQTFYLHVDPSTATIDAGTASAPTPDQTITVSVEAHDSDVNSSGASSNTVTTVKMPKLVVTKYVRNTAYGDHTCGTGSSSAVGNCAGAGAQMINGHEFYTASVTAQPFQTLEYCITVKNASAAGNSGIAKDVRITDPLASYTTLVGTMLLSADGTTFSPVTAATDGDGALFNGGTNTVTFFAGTGGKDGGASTTLGGGTLASDVTTYAIYQASVN